MLAKASLISDVLYASLLIINCLLSIACYQSLVIDCLLSITCYFITIITHF